MSLHINNSQNTKSESKAIILKRYSNKRQNTNSTKIHNYEVNLLSKSFLKLIAVIYFIIVTKNIVSCTGAITFKKILLSFLCSDISLFSSPISNIAFFSSIV